MAKFKPTQEVTPKKAEFNIVFGPEIPKEKMPQFGKIYHVELYPFEFPHPKEKYMLLSELPYALFHEDSFEALVSDGLLAEELAELENIKHDRHLIDG